ncbi:MAG TPA: CARDB domain-containing protein, partial [Candidatus Methanoperedens sp.]|nr:CARDB domain-containing protein [Candidatus Methanoperedens sp.]
TVIDGARIDWYLSPGEPFGEGVTVTNIGNGAAGASTARFYLSTDAVITGADTLLTGTLANSALGAGASETDLTLVLTVPTSPPVPEGTYYFGACADDLNAVTESNETNNCDVEGSTWIVRWAALSVTTLANPPATVLQGGSFDVTDTTANTAAYGGDAVPFVNSYYLSSDSTITTGDTLLTGTRVINGLAAVDSSNGTITVTVPSGTPTGTYYLGVCADSTGVVPEANEANNCRASTGTITVQ